MKWLLFLGLLCAGCDEWVETRFIGRPPPPGDGHSAPPIEIGEGTAAGVIFVHVDRSRADGEGDLFDAARSADERIARVFRTSRDATSRDGYPESGHVFVIYGVSPGETDLTVSTSSTTLGPIHVKVLPQTP